MKKLKYRIIQYKNDNGDTFYRAKYLVLGFLWLYVYSDCGYGDSEVAQCERKEDYNDGEDIERGIIYFIKKDAKRRRYKKYEVVIMEDIEV
jgi:hypothetical protein